MIFDSNILIYLSNKVLKIESLIDPSTQPLISVISYLEVMGYKFATAEDKFFVTQICNACIVVQLNQQIIEETILLRQKYRIKLPDAIIYSTALIKNVPLITRNTADFSKLDGIVSLINPFDRITQ